MYGWPAHVLDLAGRGLGLLDGRADRAAEALVPVVLAVQPAGVLPLVGRRGDRVGLLVGLPHAVERAEDRDVGAGLEDQLAEGQVGVGAGEVAVAGERVGAHRERVVVVRRVVVDGVARPSARFSNSCGTSRQELVELAPLRGSGARRSRRRGPRSSRWRPVRSLDLDGHAAFLSSLPDGSGERRSDGHRRRRVEAVELGGVRHRTLARCSAVQARGRSSVPTSCQSG